MIHTFWLFPAFLVGYVTHCLMMDLTVWFISKEED
jgi:hypothetical protein